MRARKKSGKGNRRTETNSRVFTGASACRVSAWTPRGTNHIATGAATSLGSVAVKLRRLVRDGSTPHTVASYPSRFNAQSALGTVSCSVLSAERPLRNSEIAGKRSWSLTR